MHGLSGSRSQRRIRSHIAQVRRVLVQWTKFNLEETKMDPLNQPLNDPRILSSHLGQLAAQVRGTMPTTAPTHPPSTRLDAVLQHLRERHQVREDAAENIRRVDLIAP